MAFTIGIEMMKFLLIVPVSIMDSVLTFHVWMRRLVILIGEEELRERFLCTNAEGKSGRFS